MNIDDQPYAPETGNFSSSGSSQRTFQDETAIVFLATLVTCLILAVVVPLAAILTDTRIGGYREPAETDPDKIKQNREYIVNLLESDHAQTNVTESNLKIDTAEDEDLESGETNGTLEIIHNNGEMKLVPITCAVCLEVYRADDTVVCSSNPKCHHVFHHDCIVDCLMTTKGDGPSCPCCRQWFCDATSWKQRGDKTKKSAVSECLGEG